MIWLTKRSRKARGRIKRRVPVRSEIVNGDLRMKGREVDIYIWLCDAVKRSRHAPDLLTCKCLLLQEGRCALGKGARLQKP